MQDLERNYKYNKYIEAKMAKTKPWPTLFHAFWVGGLICLLGEFIKDGVMYCFPTVSADDAGIFALCAIIFIASFLTGIGVYDRIGAYAGAGSIVPISGFSNSIASPAMEYKREGIVFGLCAKMFVIAGPVIVIGTVASIIAGIIYLIFG